MKRITSFLLAASAGLVCLGQTRPAEADARLDNPYGNVTTEVVIGSLFVTFNTAAGSTTYHAPVAIFSAGGHCYGVLLEMANGLTQYWVYNGSDATEYVELPRTTRSFCGVSVDPLNYDGHWFDIRGHGGDDSLLGDYGNSFLDGDSGNDLVESYSASTVITGGEGNDRVITYNGAGVDNWLYGGDGDDCLEDRGSLGNIACDSGNDRYVGNPVNLWDCETQQFVSCNLIR